MLFKTLSVFLVVVGLCASAPRAQGSAAPAVAAVANEEFEYRWTLAGFKGVLARIFVPGQGEGRLVTRAADDEDAVDLIETELLISTSDRGGDEYWLYGAEIDAGERRTVRSWSSQRFRGKSREREREAKDVDALDLASSIYYLRKERPDLASEEMIWSSGRLNAVEVRPGPKGTARWRGRDVDTRSYSIRGVSKPGKSTWSGQLDLVLTDDEQAVPLEIMVMRSGLRMRLELVDAAD